MSMLVHIARVSAEASIRKSGLRAGRWVLETQDGVESLRGVFLFPVLDNFAVTYQWVRELRRHHDERAVAVYVRGNDDEPVLVGRYGKLHQACTLGEAIRWVRTHPWGAQVVLPRAVPARQIHAIRPITQLVGWTGAPHDTALSDCVCVMCLPAGSRDIVRRARASFQRQVRLARAATEVGDITYALRGMDVPLERIGARVGIKPLLAFGRHAEPEVRSTAEWVLGICRSDTTVADQLARMTRDADPNVAAAAARSLVGVAGARRFLQVAPAMDEPALLKLVGELVYLRNGATILARFPTGSEALRARVAAALSKLDEPP